MLVQIKDIWQKFSKAGSLQGLIISIDMVFDIELEFNAELEDLALSIDLYTLFWHGC